MFVVLMLIRWNNYTPNPSNTGHEDIWDENWVITMPTDVLASDSAEPPAGICEVRFLTHEFITHLTGT